MNTRLLLAFLACLVLSSCLRDRDDESFDDPLTRLNELIEWPPGTYFIDPDNTLIDNSVIAVPLSGDVVPLTPGSNMNNLIGFSASGGNVVAAGMRFGSSGRIAVVPTPSSQGQTAGALSFPFTVGPSTCENLSQVCHDIQCYEFAITADGKISRANIRDVALMCGNCDEPSCRPLIDPPCPTVPGTGTYSTSLGSGSGTSFCNAGTLSITSSDGTVIVISNVGSSGSYTFTSDFYTAACTTCPAIQYDNSSGSGAYIGVSGTGSWSGDNFNFTASLKSIPDAVSGGGNSYTISGSVGCN